MNRDRELARKRWRKAKDHMGNREEREEFKNQGQGARERGKNKMGTSDGPQGREGGIDKKDRRLDRIQCRMEKNSSILQGRGRN